METTRYRLKYCLKGPLNRKQPTNLTKSGSYQTCKKHIDDQANTAMLSLSRKNRLLALPIEIQIELFLLYACEIWGFGNLDIEIVQLKFLKMILNLKRSTPSFMVYGEAGVLGRYIYSS